MSDILIRGMEMPKDIEPGLVIEFADGIDGKRYARLWHYRHGGLTEWVEAISAVDARPVVRARWITPPKNRDYAHMIDYYECPLCGFIEDYLVNYCPNCGADMSTEEDE